MFGAIVVVAAANNTLGILANVSNEALVVFGALRRGFRADGVGISTVATRTLTAGGVILWRALGITAANAKETARILTESIDTRFFVRTSLIISASNHTARVIADKPVATIAVVFTLSRVTERLALNVRVANEARLAGAHRSVGIGRAVGVGSASIRETAGILARLVVASFVGCTLVVVPAVLHTGAKLADEAKLASSVVSASLRMLHLFAITDRLGVSSVLGRAVADSAVLFGSTKRISSASTEHTARILAAAVDASHSVRARFIGSASVNALSIFANSS